MQRFTTALAALLLIMAGCTSTETPDDGLGSGDDDEDNGGPGDDGEGPGDDGAGPGGSDANASLWHPVLGADVENGTAPLNVTFSLDAPGADVQSWTLALGSNGTANGTELPAEVTHTFGPGNHTVVLTVVADSTRNASLSIAANAVVVPAPIVDSYTASVAIGTPWLVADYSGATPQLDTVADFAWASYDQEAPNAHGHPFTVPAGAAQLEVVSEELAPTGGVTDPGFPVLGGGLLCREKGETITPDTDLFLFKSDGTHVTHSGSCSTGEAITLEAPDEGDYVVVQLGFSGAMMEVPTTITISLA